MTCTCLLYTVIMFKLFKKKKKEKETPTWIVLHVQQKTRPKKHINKKKKTVF